MEGSGSGTVQGRGRGREKRGRSQSSSSSKGEYQDPPLNKDAVKRVCAGREKEREGEDTDSEGEGEMGTWVREEMRHLEEQGEWEQTWEEHHDRGKRRREWEEEGWELWEMGDVCGGTVRENSGSNEGMEGVERDKVDVKGDGEGCTEGEKKGEKSVKDKEKEKMALYIENWLGTTPLRTKKC